MLRLMGLARIHGCFRVRLIGFFVKIQYNYMFKAGRDNTITVPGINAPITTNPAKSFTALDLGVYFKFGGVE
jgi:hypothetical protein